MRNILIILSTLATILQAHAQVHTQAPMRLWYKQPATYFEESLPIGNGKLGALVYGGTDTCTLYLNELTLWTGCPVDISADQDAHKWIPRIREALFREDYRTADSLQLHVQGSNSQFYQPLGTLHIIDHDKTPVTDKSYYRQLDLDEAVCYDTYQRGKVKYEREYIASYPDKLVAIHLKASKKHSLNVRLLLTSQVPCQVKAKDAQITMTGHATGDAQETIHFCTMLRVAESDGRIQSTADGIELSDATEATIYIVNETSFNGFDKHPVRQGAPYLERAADDIWHTANIRYAEVRQRHMQDYQQYYGRVQLRLGKPSKRNHQQDVPTDQLLRDYTDHGGQSRYLETLYFQYGRYLLIGCSRTAGVPANLQGLWSPHLWSPWRGNYTVNINLEENYWPSFVANLSEMAEPLDGFVQALAENGKHTARNYYGVQQGWCSSHNSDIWAMTNPVGEKNEKPEWANWNMGGAWLVNTLWERYLFTQDKEYLRTIALPLMRGAADFCLGWLVANPNNPEELITAPSTSPENEYVTDQGYHGMTCYGGTADLAIIRELLQNVIAANALCGESTDAYQSALSRLHPYTIGKDGDLNEWYHDWRDYDPRHRHQSHLIGLYPGSHLTQPALLKAAEQTLVQKGDQTTGWSTGWRINLWARLKNAPQAYHIYRKLLTYVSPDKYTGPDRRRSGGTYPNLMDAHPPFQIDGNFGGTAGVCEMLMQSRCSMANGQPSTVIELLPALPAEWNDGKFSGLCARGGLEVSMEWQDGQVTAATITAHKDCQLTLLYNGQQQFATLKAGSDYHLNPNH